MPMRPALRQPVSFATRNRAAAPRTRVLETGYLAPLRIDAGHHVPDHAVLARRIHRLKNQQQRMAVGCVQKLLLLAELINGLRQKLLVVSLRFVNGIDHGWPFVQIDLVVFANTEVFGVDFHAATDPARPIIGVTIVKRKPSKGQPLFGQQSLGLGRLH